jgi:uncharacterized protein involved in cysteine biosynthesis
MLNDAAKAFAQIFTPQLRAILWKSIGLALVLVVVVAIALQRGMLWLLNWGEVAAQSALGGFQTPLTIMVWVLTILTGIGIAAGSIFLMPAITSLVASVFVDDVADVVERQSYPNEEPGTALPLMRSVLEGGRAALLSLVVYAVALPFLLFAGFGFVIFFVATAWLLGREYFELAAMRFRPIDEARAMRKAHAGEVFVAGLLIAVLVSIPIVNFITPVFAMAFMVHLHKRLSGPRPQVLTPARLQP